MTEPQAAPDRILLVDDTPANLGALVDFLTQAGFEVAVASSGEIALKQLQHQQPALILLDVRMPGMDGFETCRRLKEEETTRSIPVIFMTALAETADKVEGFKVGAVDYVTKPLHQEEVLARVQTHLTLRRLQQQLEMQNENLERLVDEKTQALVRQEKAAIIGRMIQGIAHNLKTPLAVIQSTGNLVERKTSRILQDEHTATLASKSRQLLQSLTSDSALISKAHAQIMDIINNLMLKSRMDQQAEAAPLNINQLLEQEMEFFKADARFKHKVDKDIRLDDTLPSVCLVYSHLAQVVENLIGNALDAMWNTATHQLTIITRHDAESLYIDIQDTGCGIPADKLETIFDPFYTSKPAKGEEEEGEPTGTGLGLHTCVELLKPFDGTIQIASTVGQGSTFTVVVPKQGIANEEGVDL